MNKWLDDNCEKYAHPEQTNADCDAVKSAAASRMIGSEVISICIQLYYCYVCKLYADLIANDPVGHAALHYSQESAANQSNYPPEFPTQQNHVYQRLQNSQQPVQQPVYQNQVYSQAPVYQGTNMDNAPPAAKG